MLSRVCRFYDASIIANVHNAKSRLREGDHSLVGVDAVRRIGIAPPMSYLSPGEAFVVSPVESHVACHDVLWIGWIHSENVEADATMGIGTAVSPSRAISLGFGSMSRRGLWTCIGYGPGREAPEGKASS